MILPRARCTARSAVGRSAMTASVFSRRRSCHRGRAARIRAAGTETTRRASGTPIRLPIGSPATQRIGVGGQRGERLGPFCRTGGGEQPVDRPVGRLARQRSRHRASIGRAARHAAPPPRGSVAPCGQPQLMYSPRGIAVCAQHPAEEIAVARSKPLQCAKIRARPAAATRGELGRHRLGRAIAVAEKDQPHGCIRKHFAVLRKVAERLVAPVTKRATCSRSNRAKGTSALSGSTTPGPGSSSPAARAARPPDRARPARHHEVGLRRHAAGAASELQREVDEPSLVPYTFPRYSPGGWISLISSRTQCATIDVSE